jgi:predicted SnoaL-like aldol condensation-catalyzing enzyme
MVGHRLDHSVRSSGSSTSRRTILQHLGGASAAAAFATVAPMVAVAQDSTPTAGLDANKALARRFHELFVQGNLAIADEILTPDFTWYSPPQTVYVVGPEAVKQTAKEVHDYFSGIAISRDDEIAEGDRVVHRWTITGTVQTEHGAVPVVYTGIDIFRIENGKLAELWQSTDDYGLAQQLGEIPTEGTPEAATPTT